MSWGFAGGWSRFCALARGLVGGGGGLRAHREDQVGAIAVQVGVVVSAGFSKHLARRVSPRRVDESELEAFKAAVPGSGWCRAGAGAGAGRVRHGHGTTRLPVMGPRAPSVRRPAQVSPSRRPHCCCPPNSTRKVRTIRTAAAFSSLLYVRVVGPELPTNFAVRQSCYWVVTAHANSGLRRLARPPASAHKSPS
jgi:hypothetical protein